MALIKKIYNFQKKEEMLQTKNPSWKQSTGWFIGRSIRNITILSLFVLTGYVSAKVYNEFHPNVTQAAPITVEVPAKEKLSDYPMLQRICNAEVTGNPNKESHQFNPDGSVVRGKIDPSDIGYCQINEPINNDLARKLGYDIYSEEGNQQFAIYLFKHRGTEPWNASKSMWK